MSEYEPNNEPRRSISERHVRRSVAVIEPTTRTLRKSDVTQGKVPTILPLALSEALERNPAFRVITLDGKCWIDPIVGSAVPLDNDLQQVAKAWLLQHLSGWREHGVMDLHDVTERRWRHDVLALLKSDKRRMTIFSRLPASEGQWLNPYSGCIEADVSRDNGQITALTVRAMAKALARCSHASTGSILSRENLRQIKMSLGYKDPETTDQEL